MPRRDSNAKIREREQALVPPTSETETKTNEKKNSILFKYISLFIKL